MWLRWFPWKQLVRRAARTHGFVDPVKLLARLEGFAQPLEVKVPLELLRAGMVFHARGLLNTGAIQHNRDWIWPFWVERQYDPADDAFIPRAFSLTHVNLSHRNWTAVGVPDFDELPIVDPRGLVTPFWDSWSLDAWVVDEDGGRLLPSRNGGVEQRVDLEGGMAVSTRCSLDRFSLSSRVEVEERDGTPGCRMRLAARSDGNAWLVVALRPYNPEGVSFVQEIRMEEDGRGLRVGRWRRVRFDVPADRFRFSDYRGGDVASRLFESAGPAWVQCKVGMATAAAMFSLQGGKAREVGVNVPLGREPGSLPSGRPASGWFEALRGACSLKVPDRRIGYLYETAVRSLVLLSPGDVYPGPYTYKRFWFRDAAFILHALLCAGLADRVKRALDRFPDRQTRTGFFHSQEGEWDSNGEALWIMQRYCELTGEPPAREWKKAIERGARWILRKRLSPKSGEPHAGLLPAGFSAEHLGPNDYYYWDDFWGVAGLRSASRLLDSFGEGGIARNLVREADGFLACIEESLAGVSRRLQRPGMPASPYRRMDSGSVGSLAAGYPLRLFPPRDPRLLDTVGHLLSRNFLNGGFYQDIIHSGINPYLTLHVAQVLLRAGDPRFMDIVMATADLASPTGQWPEAVHPRTKGGCMGDGQHAWASAEWVLMVRNGFVREEGDGLILGSGIFPSWLDQSEPVSFGPAPTTFGLVEVDVRPGPDDVTVRWNGEWREFPPRIEVRLPGLAPVFPASGEQSILLPRRGAQ